MSSAWGQSWGVSWGGSWGYADTAQPAQSAGGGGGRWDPYVEPAPQRKPRRPQIQANNMMLIAALLAVAQGEEDGWST